MSIPAQGAVGAETKTTPCGGCGAKSDAERCIGCLHDFGDDESAWLRADGAGVGPGWTTPHDSPVSPQTEAAARRIAARRAGGAYADAPTVPEAAWRSEIHSAEAALFGVDTALATPRTDSDEGTAGEDAWTLSRAFDLGFSWRSTLYCNPQSMEDSRAVGRTLLHPDFDSLKLDLDGWDSFQSGDIGMCEGKRRIKEALDRIASAPATPLGVPDSLRALMQDAITQARGALRLDVMVDEAGKPYGTTVVALEALAAAEDALISTHPAGQSDDGTERCIACAEPLKTGERVLSDANGGTIHAACCGPEREAYVKDVETGEPLGPNDPIPQGYAYEPEHPAGQSTGQGAETISVDVATMRASNGTDYYVRIACGGREVTPHCFKERWKAEYEAAHYAWIFGLRTDEPSILDFDPESRPNAPDSPLTGPVGVEELRKAISKALHDNQFADGWHEMVDPVVDAVLAARPAAPEAQGADVSPAERDVLAERRRQVEAEGWTPEHDDTHGRCEMAAAAACYATAPSPIRIEREWTYPDAPANWPWCRSWWKPKFYRHNLVKAAALLIAEIERWDRLEARAALARAATAREG